MASSTSNWLQLTQKTAIVTGAGSGIGSAIAKAFAQQGCNVLLVDRDENNVKQVVRECQHIQQQQQQRQQQQRQQQQSLLLCDYFVCDVTNKKQVHESVQYADSLASKYQHSITKHLQQQQLQQQESFSSSHVPPNVASILVNSAGITKDGLIHNISEIDYDDVLDINLKGTFLTCQAFCHPERLDALLYGGGGGEDGSSRESGSIINIGSIISEQGNIGQSNYSASKGGVVGLTRSLAKEMAFYSTTMNTKRKKLFEQLQGEEKKEEEEDKDKEEDQWQRQHHDLTVSNNTVRVNAILPGFIDTSMSKKVPGRIRERIKNQIPLKEFGTVDDVANMTLFLASSRSRYVTGSTLECSGMISI
eukprot:CAMPEP_0203717262 /NCGR_PEP_ID=MMETSP0092-20131115/1812_1 /ASSEMBLY_ACC=CAM_ASM_001090 /TAXON_ID=426623 /ORGANISM="Chaetoceros affinis, Strain CCMP159" /LENGTH=361 /DNA_ID=CAMNT_0050596073 /DNA_START=66 /DNA_END=1151 /DNA_ORIENTATION=+